ncbi:MAG: nicotinate-nucleotide adenylyltransferase [Crocinitomix sp.]|nr:nicotinate-nucleotide adenylyltransferase [Crocinitomix sp.]
MDDIVTDIIDGFAGKAPQIDKRVGLYFGSFNPIHIGHLIIANYMAQSAEIDEVWFVVTPQNPHKKKKNLLEDFHRLAMVRIAVEQNSKLNASDIEFHLPKPSYTTYTLQALKEKYPNNQFTLIMGEDNIRNLHKWKNYEYIIENYPIIVYPRVETIQEQVKIEKEIPNGIMTLPNVHLSDAPIMKISSSFIRNMIKEGKDVRYLLSEPVFNYLDEMNFYK